MRLQVSLSNSVEVERGGVEGRGRATARGVTTIGLHAAERMRIRCTVVASPLPILHVAVTADSRLKLRVCGFLGQLVSEGSLVRLLVCY